MLTHAARAHLHNILIQRVAVVIENSHRLNSLPGQEPATVLKETLRGHSERAALAEWHLYNLIPEAAFRLTWWTVMYRSASRNQAFCSKMGIYSFCSRLKLILDFVKICYKRSYQSIKERINTRRGPSIKIPGLNFPSAWTNIRTQTEIHAFVILRTQRLWLYISLELFQAPLLRFGILNFLLTDIGDTLI